MGVEEWDRVMETNMRGVFLTCQAAARSMKAGARAGKIITISSGAYASGRVGASHYCASKAGVVMFTRVLAMELAEQRINVNCIAPGYIKVDSGTSPPSSDFEAALIKSTPWGRLGTPADIAPAALFLASPAADYVTGEVLSSSSPLAGLLELLKPVRHAHLAIHRRRDRQVHLGLLGFPRAPVEPAEPEMAMGQKRAHLELGGHVHCRTIVCCGRHNVGAGTMRGDVA